MKSGYVAVVGRANAGKSTLINVLVGEKVAIVSPKPQTTRERILGVLTDKESKSLALRNEGRKRITPITLEKLLSMVGELPNIDFSSDVEVIKQHRKEVRKKREQLRLERKAQFEKQRNQNVKKEG